MKVLTIGGAMIDTIAIIESDRIERMSMLNAETSFLLLEEGRKTEALEVSTHCGGGGVNAAVAMARLGVAFAVDLVYVSNLSNKSADCYPTIIDKAKSNGALVAVNPGVRQLSARGGA